MATSDNVSTQSAVPVIDMALFSDDPQDAQTSQVVQQIMAAATQVGFFYVKNHGIPTADVENLFQWSEAFFKLSRSDKRQFPYAPDTNIGYLSIAEEHLDISDKRMELKEIINLPLLNGLKLTQNDPRLPCLIRDDWDTFVSFQHHCKALALRILRAYALGLGLDQDHFAKCHRFQESTSDILRCIRYPALSSEQVQEADKWTRANGHTDFGTLTLLFQDEVGGLEALLRPNGVTPQWMPIKPIKDHIVINTGDLLEFWTDGYMLSTAHRVVIPHEVVRHSAMNRDRYSIAFFNHPIDTTPLTPLVSPVLAAHSAKRNPATQPRHGPQLFRGPEAGGDVRALTAAEHLKMRLMDVHCKKAVAEADKQELKVAG